MLRPQAYGEQALVIAREVGNRAGEGTALNTLGDARMGVAQYAQALVDYTQALAITREVGERAGESMALTNLGVVAHTRSQYGQALAYHEQALAIVREVGRAGGRGQDPQQHGSGIPCLEPV